MSERDSPSVENINGKRVREVWLDPDELSKPRPLWNQRPHVDVTVFHHYTPMNDSDSTVTWISILSRASHFIHHSFN